MENSRENQSPSQWLAVQVKPRSEVRCADLLSGKGYETFVPICFTSSRPLFPGYLFSRNTDVTSALIVTTPGVIRLVGFNGRRAPIEENEINAIRTILQSGLPYEASSEFRAGDRVQITGGALSGVEGTVHEIKSKRKLMVTISLLQRSVLVDIDPLHVRHIVPKPMVRGAC